MGLKCWHKINYLLGCFSSLFFLFSSFSSSTNFFLFLSLYFKHWKYETFLCKYTFKITILWQILAHHYIWLLLVDVASAAAATTTTAADSHWHSFIRCIAARQTFYASHWITCIGCSSLWLVFEIWVCTHPHRIEILWKSNCMIRTQVSK